MASFPITPVLDNFNRSTIGANWAGGHLNAGNLPNPNGTQLAADGVNFYDGWWTPFQVIYPMEVFLTVAVQRPAAPVNETAMPYIMDANGSGYGLIIRGSQFQ